MAYSSYIQIVREIISFFINETGPSEYAVTYAHITDKCLKYLCLYYCCT